MSFSTSLLSGLSLLTDVRSVSDDIIILLVSCLAIFVLLWRVCHLFKSYIEPYLLLLSGSLGVTCFCSQSWLSSFSSAFLNSSKSASEVFDWVIIYISLSISRSSVVSMTYVWSASYVGKMLLVENLLLWWFAKLWSNLTRIMFESRLAASICRDALSLSDWILEEFT